MIVAIVLGLVFGLLEFFLLFKGVCSVAKGQMNVLYFITQFFCPLIALGLCAWLSPDFLILCATLLASILFIGAIGYYIHIRKQGK